MTVADISTLKTSNVKTIIRAILKKQGNLINVNCGLSITTGSTPTTLFIGIPTNFRPSVTAELIGIFTNTNTVARCYITTAGDLVVSVSSATTETAINISGTYLLG